MFRPLLFLCFSIFFTANPALANESLRFQAPETNKEKRIVAYAQVASKNTIENPMIAPIDLNGDLIDEYVLLPSCPDKKICRYVIIALRDFTPIIIGEFDAHKILISHKKTYGIRNFIVYNDIYNDFKSKTARWNPFSFRYRFN